MEGVFVLNRFAISSGNYGFDGPEPIILKTEMKMKGTGFGSIKTGLIANRSVHPVGEGFGFLHFHFRF